VGDAPCDGYAMGVSLSALTKVQAPFFSSLEFNQIGLVSAGQNHATIPSITATSLPLRQNINPFKI